MAVGPLGFAVRRWYPASPRDPAPGIPGLPRPAAPDAPAVRTGYSVRSRLLSLAR
ncbi:hypothetical protein GCM10010485_67200 [Streptosporangium carneum]